MVSVGVADAEQEKVECLVLVGESAIATTFVYTNVASRRSPQAKGRRDLGEGYLLLTFYLATCWAISRRTTWPTPTPALTIVMTPPVGVSSV